MYRLSSDYIEANQDCLLCGYGENYYKKLMSYKEFTPETFTVADKIYGKQLIHFRDITFLDWITGLIEDQIKAIPENVDTEELKRVVIENVQFFLQYKDSNGLVAEQIYNQEFVDIIRRIIYFTIFGDNNSELYTAKEFNKLALRIFPTVLSLIDERNYDQKGIFKLSVASGLIGLDMKGAPAASSNYINAGIPVRKYINMEVDDAARDILKKLEEIVDKASTPVFYWNNFERKLLRGGKLVWMTDDYIESFFDLYFIRNLLETNLKLNVEIIPKNGIYGNDLSYKDALDMIKLPVFESLNTFYKEGRMSINKCGPQMGAANIVKMSDENIQSILDADIFLTKGCRIHEMLQGGLNQGVFSSYIVTRELSEIVTGYNSKETPILLIYLQPNEYAFWGVDHNNSKEMNLSDGRMIRTCASTLFDHERRKKINDLEGIVNEFNYLKKRIPDYKGKLTPIYRELEMLSSKINDIVLGIYEKMYKKYTKNHFDEMNKINQETWVRFNEIVDDHFHTEHKKLSVLDVATGCGRDLVFGARYGYKMSGCDNCDKFLEQFDQSEYSDFAQYSLGSLTRLPYDESQFDIVRQNASIVHLPLIAEGYSADLALKESYRVLKDDGLLYILVKKGLGLQVKDTNDGMGARPFQFYTIDTLQRLLQRNQFVVCSIEELVEERCGEKIIWLMAFAVKRDKEGSNGCINTGI